MIAGSFVGVLVEIPIICSASPAANMKTWSTQPLLRSSDRNHLRNDPPRTNRSNKHESENRHTGQSQHQKVLLHHTPQ